MKTYRTRLFELAPNDLPRPPFKARGWIANYQYAPPHVARLDKSQELPRPILSFDRKDGLQYAPEIVLTARNRCVAQMALNLIVAAKSLYDGELSNGMLCPTESLTALPDDETDLEDLIPEEYDATLYFAMATYNLSTATALAAKATRLFRWKVALLKYWQSLRLCSAGAMDLHPRYGNQFNIERDPMRHILMAEAIVTGYSVIEELDLQIKADSNNPSKIQGKWNPSVLSDLKRRLSSVKINDSASIIWHLRNTPTRIERKKGTPDGPKAPWSQHSIRDKKIPIEEALNYASFLRSKVSAHKSHDLTKSLTLYDVSNVQFLARYTLLNALGFWKK